MITLVSKRAKRNLALSSRQVAGCMLNRFLRARVYQLIIHFAIRRSLMQNAEEFIVHIKSESTVVPYRNTNLTFRGHQGALFITFYLSIFILLVKAISH